MAFVFKQFFSSAGEASVFLCHLNHMTQVCFNWKEN